MKYEIRFDSKAENDVLEAAQYYERQRTKLGNEFLDRLKEASEIIQNHPRLFPLSHRNYRRALLRQFPYALYYRLEHKNILVCAVLHQRQDQQFLG